MAFIYILQSQKNNRYYIGSTIDVKNRYKRHIDGRVKATRYLRPLKLVFYQRFNTIRKARQIEYKLKKLKRRDIIERIIKDGMIKMN